MNVQWAESAEEATKCQNTTDCNKGEICKIGICIKEREEGGEVVEPSSILKMREMKKSEERSAEDTEAEEKMRADAKEKAKKGEAERQRRKRERKTKERIKHEERMEALREEKSKAAKAAKAAKEAAKAEKEADKAAKEAAYNKRRVDLVNKIWVSLLKEGIYFENMYPFIENYIDVEDCLRRSSLNEDIISGIKKVYNSRIFPLKELIEATEGKGEDDELFWYPPLNEGLKIIIREARGRERERREEREREEREREREEERQRERERSAQWRSLLPGARFGAWGEDARQWAMYGELWGGDYKNKKSKKKLKKTNKRKQKSKKYRKKTKHKQKSKKSKRRNR